MEEGKGYNISIPSIRLCTDNAAMIAVAGYYQYQNDHKLDDLSLNASASLELK